MTTPQKTLVTATVVLLAGLGVYEAHQAAQLRDHVQTLQQQHEALTEQFQQLQTQFDNATNRLADLLAENSRLKSNPNQMELLELRGKAGVFETIKNKNEKLRLENELLRTELNRNASPSRESNEGKQSEDVIPPGQIYFSNLSADQVVSKYRDLSWLKVHVEGRTEKLKDISLTCTNMNAMTRSAAMHLLENILRLDAGLEIRNIGDNRTVVEVP